MTIFIVPLLGLLAAHGASGGSPPVWDHTRPLTTITARLVEQAGDQVPLVRSMLEALERSDVVVYISHDLSDSLSAPPAHIRFVTRASGIRYLSVYINCWRIRDMDRIATLGHELHHALEIAADPEVRDDASLVRLYQRIGFQVQPRQFDTRGARTTESRVRRQLLERQR